MVPPENVLRSDQAIGSFISAHPDNAVVAAIYSTIHDPLYMNKRSVLYHTIWKDL